MEIEVLSIKQLKNVLEKSDRRKLKLIIASSYDNDIDNIEDKNKIILRFDDIAKSGKTSINKDIAKKISEFTDNIDFDNEKLYVCCDSGISRSSAIAAAILRKYKKDENTIWKNSNFQPNILVYKTLCKEFNLINFPLRLKYKESINKRALKKKIEISRKNSK